MRFENKVALVTGAAYGIGRAIAVAFAQEGAKLMITDYNPTKLLGTEELLRQLGCEFQSMVFDIREEAKIDEMVNRCVEKWGRIDILVNNAGVGQFNPFPTTSPDEWDTIMGINGRAMYLVSRAVVPIMMEHDSGSIVNITSIMGEFAASPNPSITPRKGSENVDARDCQRPRVDRDPLQRRRSGHDSNRTHGKHVRDEGQRLVRRTHPHGTRRSTGRNRQSGSFPRFR
jgi:NAD(P)-dependent dehydrogenase (short-subunit alcohol dehydrogenase family)